MTVSYQNDLGSVGLLGGFTSLLFKWRGSLYKLCYKELICLLVPFLTLSAVYRHALNEEQKRFFEMLVRYFDKYLNMIPLSFILGFYVTIVAQRWWNQYRAIPWPDKLILAVVMYIPGSDTASRLLRKTLVRQCNLMAVLVLRTLSDSVRERMNTTDDIVNAGFMTTTEKECYEAVKTDVNIYWLPGLWFTNYLQEARRRGQIDDAHGIKLIMEQFLDFRAKCATLWSYGWVNIPLVYTQVVTLATYSFFIACIIGRQHIENDNKELPADIYFPSWTVLQFFFYMGLLKVAEQMINPYGADDEDFELNYLLDRHAKVIDLGTDILSGKYPSFTGGVSSSSFSPPTPGALERTRKKAVKRKFCESTSLSSLPGNEADARPTKTLEQILSTSAEKAPDTVNSDHTIRTPPFLDNYKVHHIVDYFVPSVKVQKAEEKVIERSGLSLSNRYLRPTKTKVSPELTI